LEVNIMTVSDRQELARWNVRNVLDIAALQWAVDRWDGWVYLEKHTAKRLEQIKARKLRKFGVRDGGDA